MRESWYQSNKPPINRKSTNFLQVNKLSSQSREEWLKQLLHALGQPINHRFLLPHNHPDNTISDPIATINEDTQSKRTLGRRRRAPVLRGKEHVARLDALAVRALVMPDDESKVLCAYFSAKDSTMVRASGRTAENQSLGLFVHVAVSRIEAAEWDEQIVETLFERLE